MKNQAIFSYQLNRFPAIAFIISFNIIAEVIIVINGIKYIKLLDLTAPI